MESFVGVSLEAALEFLNTTGLQGTLAELLLSLAPFL